MDYKNFWSNIKQQVREITNINDQIDTQDAAARIKSNIWFRGPNVWILAFSIVIASVGLNVNSTAVIIGAMCISPLMGPIIGIGLSLGTNDIDLLRKGLKNLLIMVAISLVASFLYFLISPLNIVNPTELNARTNPTIYDVLIAFFGGLAGILESCRKERGTVLAGVAIATALMPPLCTAGYGLASGSMHHFLGAFYLFLINGVFIILSTYIMVKFLRFPSIQFINAERAKKIRTIMMVLIIAFIIPSVWTAVTTVRSSNFERNLQAFIASNKTFSGGYIYDYTTSSKHGGHADIFVAAESLSEKDTEMLLSSAEKFGLSRDQITIQERSFGTNISEESEKLMRSIYERADTEINRKEERIRQLEEQLDAIKASEIPYVQLTKEIHFRYPEIIDVTIAKGAEVTTDSLVISDKLNVITVSEERLSEKDIREMTDWLKVRMNDSTVTVLNLKK